MENKAFTYTICQREKPCICITKYELEEEEVIIPECIDQKQVVEIGNYAFHGKQIKKVVLPHSLDTIGSHAFYDCRQLKEITFSDFLVEVADGAFKNCRNLHIMNIHILQERYTCLKNLLSELNQQMLCRLYKRDQEVELVFPAYAHNYQENTMARIINQETYGAGAHYRETITKNGILYKEYDSRFSFAKNVDETETLYAIVLSRLAFPYELGVEANKQYQMFLKEQYKKIVQWLIQTKQLERIQWLAQYEETTQEQIKEMLLQLQQADAIELVSKVMQVNQQRFGQKKKTFSL